MIGMIVWSFYIKQMLITSLMETNFRSWGVWIVMLILSLLIQEQKKGEEL
jgi:hypothetical protein